MKRQIGYYLTIVCCLLFPIPWSEIAGETFDARSYLPAGAGIAMVSPDVKSTDFARKRMDLVPAIFFEDFDRDGIEEAVVFYVLEGPPEGFSNVAVFKQEGPGFKKIWENSIQHVVSFDSISGLKDINADGEMEIVAFRWIGASAGGLLHIFAWNGASFSSINADWNIDVSGLELLDLDLDGIEELIIKHRFALPSYKWTAKGYKLSNEDFPNFYSSHIAQLEAAIFSGGPKPPSAYVDFCQRAVEGYIYQKDYEGAISLCQRTMGLIANLPPNSDKIKAVSDIHVLLGDVYTVMGEVAKAAAEYEAALKLHPENKKALDKLAALQTRRK